MNKKHFLAAALIPVAFMTACNNDEILDENSESAATEEQTVVEPLAVYLTDQQGNRVENVSGEFGIYNLHIEGAEAWVIKCDDQFVSAEQTYGKGDAVVPVYVSTCWGYGRAAELEVHTLDFDAATTRAEGEGEEATTRVGISQAPAVAASTATRLGSCLGVAYAVDPSRNSDDIFMAMGQPVFNVSTLMNDNTLHDDYNFQQTEEYTLADSEKKLQEKLAINGGLSFKFGSIAATGKGEYASNQNTDESAWHCMMTNRTVCYERELNYLDEVYRTGGPRYSAGFNAYYTNMESELKAATTKEQVENIVNAFFSHYGPFFIYRANLGAELDYTCTINKTITSDSTLVKAAVEVKWEKEVVAKKDTTSTDTTKTDTTKTDTTKTDTSDDTGDDVNTDNDVLSDEDLDKLKDEAVARFFAANNAPAADKETNSVNANGDAEYNKNVEAIVSNTSAKLEIKGGTASISILANGGKIDNEQLTAWQKNLDSDHVVMVKYQAAPIYIVFPQDSKCYAYLKQYSDNAGIVSVIK